MPWHRMPALLVLAALSACGDGGAPDDVVTPVRAPATARILPPEEVLAGAHVATLDPATMNDAELRKALGEGPYCAFRYTSSGRPVLGAGMRPDGSAAAGVVKLNGSLVALQPAAQTAGARLGLAAGPIHVAVAPDGAPGAEGEATEATMIFEIDRDLKVGYRGYLDCRAQPPVASR